MTAKHPLYWIHSLFTQHPPVMSAKQGLYTLLQVVLHMRLITGQHTFPQDQIHRSIAYVGHICEFDN